MADKRYTDLPSAASLANADIMAMVDPTAGVSYQFTFNQLLTFLNGTIQRGAQVTYGTVNPAAGTGVNGDLFINTSSNQFLQRLNGAWVVIYSVTQGIAGNQVYIQNAIPDNTALGILNDVCICSSNGIFYKKIGSPAVWTAQFSMASGPAGPRGNSVLNGARNPVSTDGVDGDFWYNTASQTIFGPKATGAWPGTGTNLAPAVPNTVLNGTGNPANTTGNNGDFFINTTTWNIFGPKASGVWPAGVLLSGTGSVMSIATGDTRLTTDGSGNTVFTDPKLVNKGGYPVFATQLSNYLKASQITYNTAAGSFTITLSGFALAAGENLMIYPYTI